jgi:transaldolase
MPENTLKALATHNELDEFLSADGGNSERVLGEFAREGIDIDRLADELQNEGTESFVKSWSDLLAVISSKCASLDKSVRLKAS